MNWQLPFQSGRQPVLARNIVSTSQPLASQAGAAVFARGGNAIDAAIAAAITLTVVEPTMNGIGGDGFRALVSIADLRRILAFHEAQGKKGWAA